jgi:hypothetical protein
LVKTFPFWEGLARCPLGCQANFKKLSHWFLGIYLADLPCFFPTVSFLAILGQNLIVMETIFNLFMLLTLLGLASFVAYTVVGVASQSVPPASGAIPGGNLATDLHRRLLAKGR